MRIPGLIASTRELSLGIAGFVLALVLIDSGGLAQWATRLGIGPLRTVAVPITQSMNGYLSPLGINRLRPMLLSDLGRIGWSDDPEAEAESQAALQPPHVSIQAKAVAATVPAPPVVLAIGPPRPLVASVPFHTPLPLLLPVSADRPREVALVGDSMMAVGLGAVLLRDSAGAADLHVIKAFRSGTGLARPEVFDWLHEYSAVIGPARPDLILVTMGANDTQGYVDSDGRTLAFGSDAWLTSYRARVEAFMQLLEASSRQILWIGLPPMKSAEYDAHIAEINRIAYTIVERYPNAAWWNPAPYIGDKDGQFRDLGPVGTAATRIRMVHLRAPDGIHLSDDGAGLLTQILMPWLEPPPAIPAPRAHLGAGILQPDRRKQRPVGPGAQIKLGGVPMAKHDAGRPPKG